jgi:crossover junction endodeoxyribonuclease RuvC
MTDLILGIDVGLTGAVSVFRGDGCFIEVFDLPTMQANGKQACVKNIVNAGGLMLDLGQRLGIGPRVGTNGSIPNVLAYVETVSAMPKQGVASMFSLGHTLGTVQAVLACLHIPYLLIRPQEWKKALGLLKTEKDESRAKAIALFPGATDSLLRAKDHNRAEAILIGAYHWHRQVVVGVDMGQPEIVSKTRVGWARNR